MASASESQSTRRKPWETANPVVSGLLAFLIPGAGHLYQGRVFKGLIYLVCIHAAFFTGMCLGEGMTVHHKVPPNAQGWRQISLSYAAQFGTGIWAMPAIVQARRVNDKENRIVRFLPVPFTSSFQGVVEANGPGSEGFDGPLVGTISLEPAESASDVQGKFTGTLKGRPVEFDLANGLEMDRPIGASPGRLFRIRVARQADNHPNLDLLLRGTVPRPLWDWYEVPPETSVLQELTGRLGKYFELALVFTWIAGLLNVLAIWDCVKGPSLGFGDEQPHGPPDDPKDGSTASIQQPETAVAATVAPEAKGT